MGGIDAYLAMDRMRLCDTCGKEDFLLCITYPMAILFPGMPERRSAVWMCKECTGQLMDKISTINAMTSAQE